MYTNKIDRKTLLSTLWIFLVLNFLYADVMALMLPNLLKQFLSGTVNGIELTEEFMLGGAMLMEVSMVMVLLSRVLHYKANRWANIIAGSFEALLTISVMVMGFVTGTGTLHYHFFEIVEITCAIYIVWTAWKWQEDDVR